MFGDFASLAEVRAGVDFAIASVQAWRRLGLETNASAGQGAVALRDRGAVPGRRWLERSTFEPWERPHALPQHSLLTAPEPFKKTS